MNPRKRQKKINDEEKRKFDEDPHSNGVVSCPSPSQLRLKQEYYDHQARLLRLYEEDKKLLADDRPPKAEPEAESQLMLRCCFALNVFSLVGNLTASILSGSLSIMSTFVDSLMDFLCSAVMNTCMRLIEKPDTFNYPRGKHRLELIGVLISAILMAFANIGMAMQAFNDIADESRRPTMTQTTVVILGVQTMLKALLSWICFRAGTPSSIVVGMDLRNDVVSRICAVIFAEIGDKYWRLADPIGAIFLCTMIAISWFRHAVENVPNLVGRRGEQEQVSRILRIAVDHDPRIRCLDHLMVYHTGTKAFVELHVVMDERLPLKVTHDVCHPLEKKLQRLEFVERAFVHCDYYCDGD